MNPGIPTWNVGISSNISTTVPSVCLCFYLLNILVNSQLNFSFVNAHKKISLMYMVEMIVSFSNRIQFKSNNCFFRLLLGGCIPFPTTLSILKFLSTVNIVFVGGEVVFNLERNPDNSASFSQVVPTLLLGQMKCSPTGCMRQQL